MPLGTDRHAGAEHMENRRSGVMGAVTIRTPMGSMYSAATHARSGFSGQRMRHQHTG